MANYRYSFISHAHVDNKLCDPVAAAMTQLGAQHYYDRENPQVGHSISLALQEEIERANVLIVMVSPASIESFWVNEEIDMFFTLMEKDRSRKLIPVRIMDCVLPPRLGARWWVDAIGRTAADVVADLAPALEADAAEGYTCVVDSRRGKGTYTTIAAAVSNAHPNERILVRKGIYDGGFVIDKPLELVGDGKLGDVEIRASDTSVIRSNATHGRVANITIRQLGSHWHGMDIAGGKLEIENCDISSKGSACVVIHREADPCLRHCHIHDGERSGIFVHDSGRGVIEDCDIVANAFAGIEIKKSGAPTVRRCHIRDGKADGVYVHDRGYGLIDDCDITANAYGGIKVKTGGAPTVRNCRINQNKYEAIIVHDQGGGTFENNDVRDNESGPWDIASSSLEQVTRRKNIE